MSDMDESDVVLCKQHGTPTLKGEILITLYILRHNAVLEFPIPLMDKTILDKAVVYFDSIGVLVQTTATNWFQELFLWCTFLATSSV